MKEAFLAGAAELDTSSVAEGQASAGVRKGAASAAPHQQAQSSREGPSCAYLPLPAPILPTTAPGAAMQAARPQQQPGVSLLLPSPLLPLPSPLVLLHRPFPSGSTLLNPEFEGAVLEPMQKSGFGSSCHRMVALTAQSWKLIGTRMTAEPVKMQFPCGDLTVLSVLSTCILLQS